MGKRYIPCDHKYYHYYNANPKDKRTTDCVFRAISTAMDKPWKDVMLEMTEMACHYGYVPTDTVLINKYLKKNGWVKMKQPRGLDGTKYTGRDFCSSFNCTAVVTIGYHHVSCVKDRKIWDTWDCSDRCIGSYWVNGNK